MNSTLAMVLGLLALVVGAIGLAYKLGIKNGGAATARSLTAEFEAREDAMRKEIRRLSMVGQGIQNTVHEMPLEDVLAELKKAAKP
jgi:hypothetical protein